MATGGKENGAALERLLPFVTPYACMGIVFFPKHEGEEATNTCAGKALKAEVLEAAQSAQKKNFVLLKFLSPFLSPLGIIKLLEASSFEGIDADHIKTVLADLPRDLADDALRIAVCEDGEKRKESVHHLLPKASQAALDKVYLFAKRIKFDDEPLRKLASDKAKDQGTEMEEP